MSFANVQNKNDRSSQFRKIADKISEIAAKYSVPVTGYHNSSLPLFNALPIEKQSVVLDQISIFLKSMEVIEGSGGQLDNHERALWGAISTLRLVPSADLFRLFKSNDVIEIYDVQGIQIWRNFNFMKICSYTLEEVYSIEWFKRYKRAPEMIKECELKIGNLLNGLTPEIYPMDIAEHRLEETLSLDGYVLSAKHLWAARLRDSQSQVAAWIVVSSVNLVGNSHREPKPARKLRLVDLTSPPSLS